MQALQQREQQQERLRQQYLAAMGITPWLPRQVLPGAAPSPQWQWTAITDEGLAESAPAPTSGADVTTATQRPLPNKAPLRQLLTATSEPQPSADSSVAPVDAPASVPALTSTTPSRSAVSAGSLSASRSSVSATDDDAPIESLSASVSSVVPRFKLALIAYPDCTVISDLPVSHAQPWTEAHQQLLNAILAAVGLGGDAQLRPAYHEFHWPLDPVASFDQSEAVARLVLETELQARQSSESGLLLLMGQNAARYLLPVGQDLAMGALVELTAGSALCCHGLNEVLRLPGLKAELWRQLQPLRQLS